MGTSLQSDLCIINSILKFDTQHFKETCVSFSENDMLIHKSEVKMDIFRDHEVYPKK